MKINLGKRIKEFRKIRGLTQKQLAEKLGVTTITIQNYENNRREPNIETIGKIANVLNTTVSELFGFEVCDIEGNPVNSIKTPLNRVNNNFEEYHNQYKEYVEEMLEVAINNDIYFIRLIYNRLFPNNRENIIDNISPSKASNIINSIKNTLEFELYKIKHNK